MDLCTDRLWLNLIEGLSTWAEQIIVAVVIATIIEMILPSGNNKKYIKAVIGVYILFTIISPIIGKVTNIDLDDINYEKYFEQADTYQTMSESLSTYNNKSVEEIYITNLKQDMKNKLEEKGYVIENINIKIENKNENEYGGIEEIVLKVYSKEEQSTEKQRNTVQNAIIINKIENIKIRNTIQETVNTANKKEIDNGQKNEIKEYLSNVYNVKKNNIKIND